MPGLKEFVKQYQPKAETAEQLFLMEFLLHGLAEFSQIGKAKLESGLQFKDLLSGMFEMPVADDEDEDF